MVENQDGRCAGGESAAQEMIAGRQFTATGLLAAQATPDWRGRVRPGGASENEQLAGSLAARRPAFQKKP